jgi:ParB family chromosome partitioning protein
MSKRDSLLRAGLDSSIGVGRPVGPPPGLSPSDAVRAPARVLGVSRSPHALEIELGRIVADASQPREEFDEESLDRLAESLRTKGQLQPIRVRWDEEQGAYVIIMGERRWRAAVKAGMATISCVVHQGPVDPGELLALQLVENAVREDLKPIERARAFRKLQELHGWSGNQLAKELAIPQPTIVQALKLLELPEPVRAKVEAGELAPRTAYEISRLDDDADRIALAERVVADKMTRDQVADVVKVKKSGRGAVTPGTGRSELKLEGGRKLVISGLADDRPETLLATLREATRTVQARIRESTKGEAA